MSNTKKNPDAAPSALPTLLDVEREILSSDLNPQVRTWLVVMIGAIRRGDTLREAAALGTTERIALLERQATGLERSIQNVSGNLRSGNADLEKRVAAIEEMTAGIADAMTLVTEAADAWRDRTAPLAQLEPAIEKLQAHVETMTWVQGARAQLERALAFLAPVIAETTPPFDGAQIATRAMLDQQLALLSRTLHEAINRVRHEVSARLNEIGEELEERPRLEDLRPRRLLARWLGRQE